ncbi:MAG: radical SAM protein [Spirochaetales bacterium]|nr:radical SAM protein [Spirochaetales bacterium]
MNTELTKIHPCFNKEAAGTRARIHLPVAPKCNIQCKYCSRKYDCMNESRPGVTSDVLNPFQAASYLEKVAEKIDIAVVGIAGPGDAFAEPEKTLETIHRCKEKLPEAIFCLSTNGLALPEHIGELSEAGVTHVTVTMNTLDVEIGQNIYAWARFNKKNYRGADAARLLIDRQIESVRLLKESGITVKINTILIPGINESQIIPIAKMAQHYDVDLMNVIPLIPVEGTAFENFEEPSCRDVESFRSAAGEFVDQSRHCKRCRADAVGILGEDTNAEIRLLLEESSQLGEGFTEERTKIAFVSREGVLVNQHLGEAGEFYIYEPTKDELQITDIRKAPAAGGGNSRWKEVAEILNDCAYVLTGGAGDNPVRILGDTGLSVLSIEGLAHDAAKKIFSGESVKHLKVRKSCKAGSCGSGNGCD